MKKSFKKLVSLFTGILMVFNMIVFTPMNVSAQNINNNGNWNSKYHYGWSNTSNIESIVKENITNISNPSIGVTTEADYTVRVGDIDDFGLGWNYTPNNFFEEYRLNNGRRERWTTINPFSGESTSAHYWGSGNDPYDNFKWDEINKYEPNGLDAIITVSSYEKEQNVSGIGADGYSNRQIRIPQYPGIERAPKITPKDEKGIININHNIKNIKDQNNNFEVKAAKLQMFVDDFQPKAGGATAGGATYQVKFIADDKTETRIPEFEELINHLNQTGPVGKLITFEMPSKYYDLLENNNNLHISIDDPTTGAGDGYAIDFVKLLINPKDLMHEGTIKGKITDIKTNQPIGKAYVEVNGKWRIYTDEQGNYKIPNVTSGLASVKAYKAGAYIGKTKTIDVVDNQESILNFQLEPFSSLDNSIEVDKTISNNLGQERQEEYEIDLEVKNKNIENNKILDNDSTENNNGSTSSSSNKISGYVWYDGKEKGNGKGNGKIEPNEEGINGVTVKLYDSQNNCIMTTKTKNYSEGSKGYYLFEGLRWSGYRVKVELPEGYKFTIPGKGNGGGVYERISKADPQTGMTDVIYPYSSLTNIGLIGGKYIENVEESITVSDFVIEDEVSDNFDIVPNSFKVTLNGRDYSSKVEFIKKGNKLVWKFDDIGNKEDILTVSYKIKRPNKDVKTGRYPTSTKPSTITYTLTDGQSIYKNKKEFPQVEAELKNNLKAPLTLTKSIDKDKYEVNEEITINYKIQPEPIPAENIIPESYLKNKEIVLVMDTSGSMNEYIDYNDELNEDQSIFEEKYAPRNLKGELRRNGRNYYYEINFDEPAVENENDLEYLTFYTDKETDELEKYLENLVWYDYENPYGDSIWGLQALFKAHCNTYNNGKRILQLSYYKDLDGNRFNRNKSYNLYVATIANPRTSNAKVIGLSKTGDEINSQGRKKKIDVMKDVSKNFIEKFKKDEKTKIALVPYESYAKDVTFNGYNFANLSNSNQYEAFVNKINNLTPYGGTNIGDGLRKAYYKFSSSDENTRKYVILMTDGEPTFHSSKNGKFYLGNTGNYHYSGGGDHSTYNDRLYANKVAKDLILNGEHKIDSFMIAFSNDADKNELKNIANSANGYYKEAVDGSALDEVYQKLAEQIQSDLPIHGINFKETFPQEMKIIDKSDCLQINGQTVSGDIGSISYKLNEQTKQFEAEPFDFFVKLKATKAGEYSWGKDSNNNSTSYIDYKDIDGSDGHKNFPQISVSICEEADIKSPIASIVTITSNNKNNTSLAKVGDTITLIIETDEDINKPIITIAGKVANIAGIGSNWTATYIMQRDDIEGSVDFTLNFVDKAGNKAEEVTSTTDKSIVIFDKTPPEKPIIKPSISGEDVKVTITYPNDGVIRKYKINNDLHWTDYKGEIVVGKEDIVYAICYDEAGNESEIAELELNISSNIVKQGLFVNNNADECLKGKNEGDHVEVDVVNTLKQYIGVKIEINSPNPNINISVDKNKTENTTLKIYEVKGKSLIQKSNEEYTSYKDMNTGLNKFDFEKGKIYIVVYSYIPFGNAGETATNSVEVDGTVKKLKMNIKPLPILE
ncbi:SdrD B-like domain-containing protein [Tepidibacter hydrothermalis]|uniref:SdrD B-like domain-containing protein n=1 Tax=Tepidibacter hydrothermalis TaxID=3036126 RepID=A0ABY8EDM9_9FIRM|nr:SdrD B-like domain-containing protein [Tepidibacter hydrothermalis]WFD11048.1 SdrD B-like domain-containing protein [Tepidibacter hydrothermalis]